LARLVLKATGGISERTNSSRVCLSKEVEMARLKGMLCIVCMVLVVFLGLALFAWVADAVCGSEQAEAGARLTMDDLQRVSGGAGNEGKCYYETGTCPVSGSACSASPCYYCEYYGVFKRCKDSLPTDACGETYSESGCGVQFEGSCTGAGCQGNKKVGWCGLSCVHGRTIHDVADPCSK
jgi:hypothetical protein